MGARVLIIEDNATNLELMRYLLGAFGHEPVAAEDGESGIAKATSQRPDAIICDIQMPGIDGFDVLRRLRAIPALAGVPVIAVTALAMVGDRERVLEAGFDGYISKPIEPTAFVPQVEAFLAPGLRGNGMPRSSTEVVQASAPAPARGKTVLVVDNNPANRYLARSLLESAGFRVVEASSAVPAFEIAHRSPPDLIVSDVRMSEGSGHDLIRAVKADPRLAAIPFVFLTSTFTDQADRREGLALGAVRYLFRPIDPAELLRELRQALGDA
ncbi:MAG TPA: response regulator [Usitatibacter sp.]|jgi:two-component system cell cycle response regulator|nr:response regulator [Usitatibacter sp.]